MGMFSWFTQDDNHRIVAGEKRTIYMTDNKGNTYREDCYEGYGEFGGKDYYELLAEMNGIGSNRGAGIQFAFENSPNGDNPNCSHPSITTAKGWYCGGAAPKCDPNQGFADVWEDEEEGWDD